MALGSPQVPAAGADGVRASMELRHAAEAGGQHGAAQALPPAGPAAQGRQARRAPGAPLREPARGRQDQAGGPGEALKAGRNYAQETLGLITQQFSNF